jgi:deoxyadenosine/deoxycytidine kinase
MAIICLEGASGIGKTTSAAFMAEKHGYVGVPEVNELFKRPVTEPSDWYFEMQVRRWEIAKELSESGKVAILDGDHLQPVWCNWIFEDLGLQPVDEVLAFYSKAFASGAIGFPDAYVVLSLGVEELRLRKESDSIRSRRNFETHLRLIEPQKGYFKALKAYGLEGVSFIEATSPEKIANLCLSVSGNIAGYKQKPGFDIVEKFFASKVTSE